MKSDLRGGCVLDSPNPTDNGNAMPRRKQNMINWRRKGKPTPPKKVVKYLEIQKHIYIKQASFRTHEAVRCCCNLPRLNLKHVHVTHRVNILPFPPNSGKIAVYSHGIVPHFFEPSAKKRPRIKERNSERAKSPHDNNRHRKKSVDIVTCSLLSCRREASLSS